MSPLTHSGHPARTEGGNNLVVRAGKVRLRRLPVNRHGVAHAADCGMAGEDRFGAIRASIYHNDIDVEVLRH